MKTKKSAPVNAAPIEVGSVVKANPVLWNITGYFRVKSIRGRFANLCGVFGKHIYHKSVPVDQLIECKDEWYSAWSKTESYQCM